MSMQRSPRVDRDTAEHLVAGHGVGPVAAVLRAAAAPPYREELAGEEAVIAAFRAAAVAVPRRRSAFRTVLAKVLTVKAVIVLAIAGSTGIVLAASEGKLPVPWSDSPAVPPATTTTTTTTPPAQHTPGSRTTDHRRPPAATDPSIVGLCQAYRADDDRNLDNPAFRALVDAAGGKAEIDGYCAEVGRPGPGDPARTAEDDGRPDEDGDSDEPNDEQEDDQGATPPAAPPSSAHEPPAEPGRPSKSGKPKPPTENTTTTTTETPDRSAPGAATAVPPSGAEPPSEGD